MFSKHSLLFQVHKSTLKCPMICSNKFPASICSKAWSIFRCQYEVPSRHLLGRILWNGRLPYKASSLNGLADHHLPSITVVGGRVYLLRSRMTPWWYETIMVSLLLLDRLLKLQGRYLKQWKSLQGSGSIFWLVGSQELEHRWIVFI